jgi:hypothetical protein
LSFASGSSSILTTTRIVNVQAQLSRTVSVASENRIAHVVSENRTALAV